MTVYIFWRCRTCGMRDQKTVHRKGTLTVPYRCGCGSTAMIYRSNTSSERPDWHKGDIPPPRSTTPEQRGELRCHRIENDECKVCGCAVTRECSGVPMDEHFKAAASRGDVDYYNYREQWPI